MHLIHISISNENKYIIILSYQSMANLFSFNCILLFALIQYSCSQTCTYFQEAIGGYCQCKEGYFLNTDTDTEFCDICHTSCKQCYGPLNTNCITCSDRFDFISSNSSCSAPNNLTDKVVVNAYTLPGFSKLSGWIVTGFDDDTYQCGIITLLGLKLSDTTTGGSMKVSLTSLPAHYQIRVKVNYYFYDANGTSKSAVISAGSNSVTITGDDTSHSFHKCSSSDPKSYVYRYIDTSIPHSAIQNSNVDITFDTNVNVHFGIRDVIIIIKRCHSVCATCSGYESNQCLTCSQSTKRQAVSGVCTCKDDYYEEPYSGQCVDPCPSVPVKLYGDTSSRKCIESCSSTQYALDDTYRCVTACPLTSSINSLKLFTDQTNRKCVANCPATQPYGYEDTVAANQKCYAYKQCPSGRKSSNTTAKRCVATCPHTTIDSGTYKTYAHDGACIAFCPDGYWGDPGTAICRSACLTSSTYKYMDNSTGENLCVSVCPAPNRFLHPTNYHCVQVCPDNFFGDVDRTCKAKCVSPNWGLESYNKKCVAKCPSGTWAEPTDRICVQTTLQCNPKFANSYLRKCVVATSCQYGTFADPDTWSCVTFCPEGRFGNTNTRKCETNCASPFYADDGNNLCVSTCMTANTYATQTPTRSCVTQCNQTGTSTPWADQARRLCVSDCNHTVDEYVSDNTTWKCVYECPDGYFADRTTVVPKCVTVCPSPYFGDVSTGTGICVRTCPSTPPLFGDSDGGMNLCVEVCTAGTFGDETATNFRQCRKTCPSPYFAQNDDQRRCVKRCNSTTFGYQETCTYHAVDCPYSFKRLCYEDPHSCPGDYFGDYSTNLCVDPCPAAQVTFGDPLSKLCVRECPDNPDVALNQPHTYFADQSIRKCVLTCNGSHTTPLFGNNATRRCVPVCLDYNSYAESQTTYRLCVAGCLTTPAFHYANNHTKVCGPSIDCQIGYYGENTTQLCVESCPLDKVNWAYKTAADKICIDQCPKVPNPQYGDNSTGKFICVDECPSVPDRYADIVDRVCVDTCDSGQYGQPVDRTCTALCPNTYFALDTTGRCVKKCPQTYFADNDPAIRKCHASSSLCSSGFGDSYKRECVGTCTGPAPVNTFGLGDDCVSFCTTGYADSHTGTRLCVTQCPGTVDSLAAPNLYGDPDTKTCVAICITPSTWADPHTRKCEPECSSTPPLYSENFGMTCVASLDCPTTPNTPTMTFGDNTTRSCVSFCSNNQFGDPTSRNCVTRCPDKSETGTQTYYGDVTTGQYICVLVCPEAPRLFGENVTNLCVGECPGNSWGDQTGRRTCVDKCPDISGVLWYAQNDQKICVTVCKDGTWGRPDQKCVEDPFDCGALWADDSTNLCVVQCPQIAGLFADPTTNKCVQLCEDNYFASDLDRKCVQTCPENNGVHDTFGNNETRVCDQYCQQDGAFADPQTTNRLCVLSCSQSPSQSFADPSTKFCVPQCPTHPPLFGETQSFTCVTECQDPYFADTHTRRCQSSCPTTQFKLLSPRKCVTQCPSDPELYGDSNSGFCQSTCTSGFKYGVTRMCVSSCATYNMFQYNSECVKFCPDGYYANSTNNCITPCPGGTFGENTTTTCRSTCITGYAHDGLCKAICPDNLYGQNNVCVPDCSVGNASDHNNLCVSDCPHGTFKQGGDCKTSCTSGTYADPKTNACTGTCSSGTYGDPNTDSCVSVCPVNWFRDGTVCKSDCSPKRADNITLNCEAKCSSGTWGYNFECVEQCPGTFYGHIPDRDCYDVSNPRTGLFADNITKTWVSVCSENPLRFGDRQSHECVEACSDASQYRDPYTRQCETSCSNSSYYLDQTTKSCVLVCPETYHANPDTGTCQKICTNNRFNYEPGHLCVITCPRPYYGYDDTANGKKICVINCPTNTFAEGDLCKSGCTLPLYADSTTNRCVSQCIDSYASDDSKACDSECTQHLKIADNSTNKCVALCPEEPDYYQQNGFCVMHCQQDNHYADPTSGVRECTTLCTEGLYGDPVSGRCVTQCLPGYYAYNDTNLCLQQCISGFADNQTRVCVADCPAPTFADSLTNKCTRICSGTQYGQGRLCTSMCSQGLYGDPLTRQCQSSCSDFDYSFAENNTNLCVRDCSAYPNQYADRAENICVSNCTVAEEYMLDVEAICTSLCPEDQFMENSTKRCQTGCTTGYAEQSSRYCVARCFGYPQTFADISNKVCVYQCLSLSLYADNSTNQCVAFDSCNASQNYYSDPLSGYCVLFCPEGYWAQDTTRTCTTYCATGFADNYTRKCVPKCPIPEETYGDPNTHRCVKVCPDQWFANNDTQECVGFIDCPSDTWADNMSKHCVARCPSEPLYFGHNSSRSCVTKCPADEDLYGDYQSQTCIPSCYAVNGELRFADPISQTCVYICPIEHDLFGDTQTGLCTTSCTNDFLRDNSTQRCVEVCPSDPDYFGYITDSICVRFCPDPLYSTTQGRLCIPDCGTVTGDFFGDPTTNQCVTQCPQPYFQDDSTDKCVLKCPESPNYLADNHTRACVDTCPWDQVNDKWRTYQETTDRTCTTRCPPDQFAQNSSRKCLPQCPPNQFADPITQICVEQCTLRPGYYKQTNDRVCVQQCPDGSGIHVKAYKYEVNHTCVETSGILSGCPGTYFANPETDYCTQICPDGYFADSNTKYCVTACSSTQFADPVDRKCKTGCTQDPASYALIADQNACVKYCPQNYYSENVTWTCVQSCPNTTGGAILFKYLPTRQCVFKCPAPYYAYYDSIQQQCVLECPDDYFAQDQTRTCDSSCTNEYFADSSTNKCVQLCPQDPDLFGYQNQCITGCPEATPPVYKDTSTRQCVLECPLQPLLYGDDSTNICVQKCPPDPNYFADNETRTCVSLCSPGSFAEVSTRTCVKACPDELDTYAYESSDSTIRLCQAFCPDPFFSSDITKQCVDECPNIPKKTYAYIDETQTYNKRKCVERCPDGLFGNNDTRVCETGCTTLADSWADQTTDMCVTTCPPGFFAYNGTSQCRRDCLDGLYTDPSTRMCVTQCPGSTTGLFADPTTFECVQQCPSGHYGDKQTWTCLTACPDTTSGYKLEVARLCVEQCSEPYFALVSQRLCVNKCGDGLYGDPVTRQCQTCPTQCLTCISPTNCLTCSNSLYLQFGRCLQECTVNNDMAYYANNFSMRCVSSDQCPSGTFGLNQTKSCSESCPNGLYGDQTTRKCELCPSTCRICTGPRNCSECNELAEYSETDFYCYAHCNLTHQYTYATECFETCPEGTYIDYTRVRCEACNAICMTCQGNALNCTHCDGTFRMNNTCLTQCPDGYYSENNVCQVCQDGVASCLDPLSFTTQNYVQNYKQVVVMKFNQKTQIEGDPSQFIKVKIKSKRLLQKSVSDLINDGLQYEAQILPDGTIKLYLQPGISLDDVDYQVVVTDPSKIKTQSGATLQTLEAQVQMQASEIQVYQITDTEQAPLVIAGTILSIIILCITFINIFTGSFPSYLAIQAIQLTSLFAYCSKLPPNLYFFLKQMRITRFVFMPNIFTGIYVEPETYDKEIPQKVIDTEGQLSFAINGTTFFFFIVFYLVIFLFVYLLSTKLNGNRPLKNLFKKIFNTRVKFGIVNDFIWLLAINTMMHGALQFYYLQNPGQVAFGVVMIVSFLILMLGIFCYGYSNQRTEESIIGSENSQEGFKGTMEDVKGFEDRYYMFIQGTKEESKPRFFFFVYYLRKVLFVLFMSLTMFRSEIQAGLLLGLFLVMMIVILVIRPYVEQTRNIMAFLNQGFLGFLSGGVIYYHKMIESKEPSGAKITCGQVLTIVIIVHLSLISLYSIYRTYIYFKHLREQGKKSQFYKLYLDDEYNDSLEKELSEIAGDEDGDIESIQITNVGHNEYDNEDDGEQIIKLKIKRKVKKEKLGAVLKNNNRAEEQSKALNYRKANDYLPLNREQPTQYYEMKTDKQQKFHQLQVQDIQDNEASPPQNRQKHDKDDGDWVQMKNNLEEAGQPDNKELHQNDKQDYEQMEEGEMNNIFQQVELESECQQSVKDKNLNKQSEDMKQSQSKNRERMKRNISSINDFDEDNFFPEESNNDQQNNDGAYSQLDKAELEESKAELEENKAEFNEAAEEKADEEKVVEDKANHNDMSRSSSEKLPEEDESPVRNFVEQSQKDIKSEQDQGQGGNMNESLPNDEPSQENRDLISQNQEVPFEQKPSEKQQSQHYSDQQMPQYEDERPQTANDYQVFNMDELIGEDSKDQSGRKDEKPIEQEQQKKKNWEINIEDLMEEEDKNMDDQEKKNKQKAKQMHMMLFEDDEDD